MSALKILKSALFGLVVLPLITLSASCTEDTHAPREETKMNTDIEALKRLINLPEGVARAEWQTGQRAAHGGDWWVAAILEIDPARSGDFLSGPVSKGVVETPQGLDLSSSFSSLASLPGAQQIESGGIRLLTETYGVIPYVSSPLINGNAIKLSANQVFVVLWTN